MSIIEAAAAASAARESSGEPRERIRLDKISIREFRNLERVDLELPSDGAVIVGDNGHGKTNFLEAIYYLQIMRSIRDARDQDLTRFDTTGFHISAHAHTPDAHEISVGFDRNAKRKKVSIDGTEVRRLSDALGALPSVMFSPRDLELVSGSPAERRRYLDLVLALTDRKYLQALQHYRANLAQRNAALRNATRRGSAANEQQIAVWEPALAEHGSVLIESRAKWVRDSSADFSDRLQGIGEKGDAQMRYVSPFADSEARHDVLLAAFEEKRALDLRRGITHVGPHRDDLELTLDGRDLRLFGSAGQQRSAAIALRLLEAATLRKHAGAEPLLLLDDPFAELDIRRAARILVMLEERGLGQTILVVPREADVPPGLMRLDRFQITDGAIKAWVPKGIAKALTQSAHT
ncbi:MAG TPA: DNA replication and repair protein RecF [Gemmatimonadaceae bacterium]|nr:DNA replication and repair protein RecF [Gemmatimonadaceae bacterium]